MLPATSCLLTAARALPSFSWPSKMVALGDRPPLVGSEVASTTSRTDGEHTIVENQALISTLPLSPVHNQADTNGHTRVPSATGNASTSYSTHLSSPAQTSDLGSDSTSCLASACAKLDPKTREGSPSILVTVSVHGNDWEPAENVNECSASSGRSRCQGRRDTSRPESRPCSVVGTPSVEMMTLTPSSSLSTSTCDAGMSLSKSSRSSLRMLTEEARSSITLLAPTTAPQSAPSHLPRGCSMRLSKSSDSSLRTATYGRNSPPFSDRLRVPPSSCSRRQSAISLLASPTKTNGSESSRASSIEASWSTGGITPPFTRLGLNAPGVILPLTVKQYQRQQTLKKRQQEGKSYSIRGPSPRTSSIKHQSMKKEGNLDDYTSPPFHLASAMNSFGVTIEEREQVSDGREEMADTSEASCNQEENRPGSGDADGCHTEADAVPPQLLASCNCTFEAGRICECPGYITATLVQQIDRIRPQILGEEGQEAGTKQKEVKKKRTTRAAFLKFVTKFGRGVNAVA